MHSHTYYIHFQLEILPFNLTASYKCLVLDAIIQLLVLLLWLFSCKIFSAALTTSLKLMPCVRLLLHAHMFYAVINPYFHDSLPLLVDVKRTCMTEGEREWVREGRESVGGVSVATSLDVHNGHTPLNGI